MLNEYYHNGMRIINIVSKTKRKTKYFVLENGTEIKVKTALIQTKCIECRKLSSPTTFYTTKDKHLYICPTCRGFNHNPFAGKKHSEKTKDIIRKKAIARDYSGERNPMHGKTVKDYMSSEKYIQWKANIKKAMIANPPMKGEKLRDHMSAEKYIQWKENVKKAADNMSEETKLNWKNKLKQAQRKQKAENYEKYIENKRKAGRISHLSQGNYKINALEKKVELWLKVHSINYEYSCIMGSKDKCYQYDFIIHKQHILIEVQGDYWHANKKYYNKSGKNGKRKYTEVQIKNIKRDKEKKKFALQHGFTLIYLLEDEINKNDYSKLERVLNDSIS